MSTGGKESLRAGRRPATAGRPPMRAFAFDIAYGSGVDPVIDVFVDRPTPTARPRGGRVERSDDERVIYTHVEDVAEGETVRALAGGSLLHALDHGYYRTPREGTFDALLSGASGSGASRDRVSLRDEVVARPRHRTTAVGHRNRYGRDVATRTARSRRSARSPAVRPRRRRGRSRVRSPLRPRCRSRG